MTAGVPPSARTGGDEGAAANPKADDAAARARAAELVGRVLSERYRIVELVAMGAMGAVYRGEHLLMHKDVAIKVLHPNVEGFPDLVARFQREAVAGAHISHPNVATASDFGRFDGDSYFLVLEFIRGTTVRDVLGSGPLPAPRAVRIARQLAAALGAAHDQGIVHRDLKPRNVMLVDGTDDVVKLIDFGFARVPVDRFRRPLATESAAPHNLTAAGVVFGTVGYMAPEIALGMDAVDERSDLYVLGALLYELLAGKPPFEAPSPRQLLARHRHDRPPPIAERNPAVHVPPGLEAVVMRLLEKDPGDRYASARDVVTAIDEAMAPRPSEPEPRRDAAAQGPPRVEAPDEGPPPPQERAAGARSRRARSVALPLFVAVLLVGAAGAVGLRGLRRPAAPTSPTASREVPAAATPSVDPPVAPSAPPSAAPGEAIAPAAANRAEFALSVRLRLLRLSDAQDAPAAAGSLLALVDADPSAFRDPDVRRAAVNIAVKLESHGDELADKIYYALSYRLGSDGLDVLYAIIELGKSTRASARASAILGQRDVLVRATGPLQIAFELRRAPCQYKPRLFGRAGKDGDERTLVLLETLRSPQCDATGCCFRHHEQLEAAVSRIRGRAL